jgi:hypothetical protein
MAVSKIEESFNGGGGRKAVVLEPTQNTPTIDNTSPTSPKRVDDDADIIVVPNSLNVILQTPPITPSTSLNLILEDGPQYGDDGLRMKNRAGRIERNLSNQPSDKTSDEIGKIDDIRNAADELGLTGTEPIAVLDLTNPNIRFLIALYPTQIDKVLNENRILITGKKFYQKLKSDLENGNPYSYNLAFDDRFIVKLVIGEWIDLFNKMAEFESVEDVGVTIFKNIFIEVNSTIDYIQLLNYIDWFVSKPDYTNFSDKGIISPEIISDYWIKDRILELPQEVIDNEANSQPQEPTNTNTNVAISGPQYPPVGRPGTIDGESVAIDNVLWIWDDIVEQWFEERFDGGN